MIVRCPNCSCQRNVPGLDVGEHGSFLACSACGHEWIESSASVKIDTALPVPMAKAGTVRRGPEPDLRHIVNAAREAREAFEASRHRRRLRAGAWLLLACLAASPAAAGLTFPERTVALVPAAGMIYDQLGWDINIYGLDIRDVDLQHLVIDGKKVIAVKGELVNVSSTSRKIPWLRFGLRSNAQTELYHWTLDTEIRPLKPGESTSFVTRLASPPDSASNLEIRFAQGDEIGSNTTP